VENHCENNSINISCPGLSYETIAMTAMSAAAKNTRLGVMEPAAQAALKELQLEDVQHLAFL